MKIKLKYFNVSGATGLRDKVELEAESIGLRQFLRTLFELSKGMAEFFDPETGDINTDYHIAVNGSLYWSLPQGLDTQLKDGDEVQILNLAVGGG